MNLVAHTILFAGLRFLDPAWQIILLSAEYFCIRCYWMKNKTSWQEYRWVTEFVFTNPMQQPISDPKPQVKSMLVPFIVVKKHEKKH